jgi:hypothetical protein
MSSTITHLQWGNATHQHHRSRAQEITEARQTRPTQLSLHKHDRKENANPLYSDNGSAAWPNAPGHQQNSSNRQHSEEYREETALHQQ